MARFAVITLHRDARPQGDAGDSTPPLLEREPQLLRLQQGWARVAAGDSGVCALVGGDAGIGKTTLAQAFARTLPPGATLLQAGCEALYSPRPLGPWLDLAARFPPPLERALLQAQGAAAPFGELLRHFRELRAPALLVVEDVHWADTGSLELLHYLGRRMRELRLMLLLTYRHAGLDAEHPLQRVLGELPPATTLRLQLAPLSLQAVARLACGRSRSAEAVFASSGGNPFYVSELLAVPEGLPQSVRDAVLADLARLPAAARTLAQWVSLFPGRVERALLDALLAPDAAALDAALAAGLLVADGAALAFRHEIAREAVYASLPAAQRAERHAAIHAALAGAGDADIARRVHHAEAAGLDAEVAALAPRAAALASARGAHREAARLYTLALALGAALAATMRAALLEALADEYLLINRHGDAIRAREQAGAIHAERRDALRSGANLRALARLHWFDAGLRGIALRLAQQAIDTLEPLLPSRELALAFSTMSHLCLVGEDMRSAQLWGLRAIELAEAIDDAESLCHALNNVGCARLRLRDDALAWDRLARSLELALQHGLAIDAARAYNNLFILSVVLHDFEPGLHWAEAGIAFCEAQGLDVFNVRIRIRRAFARIVMGQWDLADADLAVVAERHSPSAMEAATLDFVAALLALRRGAQGAPQRLAEAVQAMHAHRVEIWFITTAAALAESAWLAGDDAALIATAQPALQAQLAIGDHWRSGELAVWLHSAGVAPTLAGAELPAPYAHELAGRWREAATEWQRLGCPYDRALALAGSDDADALREALAEFERLGALPAAQRLRGLLRERGVRGVPRGPQPRTRDDPLGLTTREREVFALLRQGLSNATIAARLHRSERTVEHHVAAVLRKAGAATRVELIARGAAPPVTYPRS